MQAEEVLNKIYFETDAIENLVADHVPVSTLAALIHHLKNIEKLMVECANES